jgi:aryl-alcohol dehydrogenase-like predicted oxidoreductase
VHPIASLETEYSLWSRDIEGDVLNTCRKLGIALMAYSPLGRGFLTGTIKSPDMLGEKDARRGHPRFKQENIAQNVELLQRLEKLAAQKGVTTSQLALAWVHAQGQDIFPIPGTKQIKYLEQNVAAQAIRLTSDELRALDEMFPRGAASGTRYPEPAMGSLGI